LFRGRALTHSVEAGMAVFENDILLGRADELPAASAKDVKRGREAVAITNLSYRWPGGIIPYKITSTLTNQARVTSAVAHWNTMLAGHVKFVPQTTEANFVNFVPASSNTCSSYVGRLSYEQPIQVGSACSTGNVIHEMGHAVGLWHEQSREDRDGFVKIMWENILSGTEYNFYQNIGNGDDIGPYNFASIMHYAKTAFSKNGQATIQTIPAGISIGVRTTLSDGDIAAVKLMYPAETIPNPVVTTTAVTIASNPAGMSVSVDGVSKVTPVTVEWTVGSSHTISALDPQSTNGVRNTFARWSDGGAASHTVMVPAAPTTFRADYVTSYAISATALPSGTITTTPVSADMYYPSGSVVSLSAAAPAGYCFTGWTGFLSGTPSTTNLAVDRSYAVQANFQAGAFTVSPATASVAAAGGTVSISVAVTGGCQWSSSSAAAWASITAGASGSGSSTVTVSVAANTGTTARSATITIAGQPVTISQSPASSDISFALTPASKSLLFGQSVTLWPVITGTYDKKVQWAAPEVGTMSTATTAQTTYTYTTAPTSNQNIVTIKAALASDPSNTATAVLTLVPPRVKVSLSDSAYLRAGAFRYVTGSVYDVSGPAYAGVTWQVTPAVGVFDAVKGTYTAPSVITQNTEVRLTATSVADPRQSSTVVIYLVP
jgi:astacin